MVVWWLMLGALLGCSSACETGVAFERNVLSVTRSLMANADVALLKNFTTDSLKLCMEQCCTGRYGSCSVASFKNNATSGNCLHFYCRPLTKCKFQPSDGIDSFSFSSNPTPSSTTPDDDKNSTVKPRKGVDHTTKSGIKPRKGVNLDDAPEAKSNVKARKGVEEGPPPPAPQASSTTNDDLMADLVKILADDSVTTTTTESPFVSPTSTTTHVVHSVKTTSYSSDSTSINQKTLEVSSSTTTQSVISTTRTPHLKTYSESEANRRLETSHSESEANRRLETSHSESEANRRLETSPEEENDRRHNSESEASRRLEASHSESEANRLLEASTNSEEEENDRRYKSSIHLVLSLVFGLLVLFAVLGVVAKRVYDGWLRRDYYRMNYLIDGIYNAAD